jgi:hypothetical protein
MPLSAAGPARRSHVNVSAADVAVDALGVFPYLDSDPGGENYFALGLSSGAMPERGGGARPATARGAGIHLDPSEKKRKIIQEDEGAKE